MTMINNLITGLLKEGATQEFKTTSFQPGQILNGKIIKLFPNGIASLQVGSQKIVAQLEASLEANQKYWFQVQPGEGKVRLKVVGHVADIGPGRTSNGMHMNTRKPDTSGASLAGLLKELSIPVNEENTEIMRFFLKEQLPIGKEIVHQTASWLKESDASQDGLEAVKQMLHKQLPMTKTAFQAVLAIMNNESFTESLETLGNLLKEQPLTKVGNQLALFIDEFNTPGINVEKLLNDQKNGMNMRSESLAATNSALQDHSAFTNYLKGLMKNIGFSYEHEVAQFLKQPQEELLKKEALKPLLLDLLKETSSGSISEIAEKVLHKITGLQILSQDSGPTQQFVVQVPVALQHKVVDLTMQWSGRKRENGQIDPAYCRILFYLELENLRDTIVDMQVQNRVMTISVMNENDSLKQIASPFIEQLRESLKSIDFKLSAVHFTQPSKRVMKRDKQQLSPYFTSSQYSGVDLRI
ncbi:hypothetical protein JMM81_03660 [Bacillus sp. V3B]|uniref:hypothetical protein n=1 Tax=Bacillus sp. V3B TaxID=2804915 RepID=UPI00210CC33A|nr:hypothetical protein [Bacillus sp. V3B]MCQ6274077.1 hypothetical protein [Bacillus sp. V3B]